jgi:hypothetical protein
LRKTIFSAAACCGAVVIENSSSSTVWRDSNCGTHLFARFNANYKNCPPRSQTVKTEVLIQPDSTTHGAESQSQPSNAFICPDPLRFERPAYQLCMVPSRRRFTGRYARR